ncbi:hypothetical protein ACLOJK_017451 [Asimina triloba]
MNPSLKCCTGVLADSSPRIHRSYSSPAASTIHLPFAARPAERERGSGKNTRKTAMLAHFSFQRTAACKPLFPLLFSSDSFPFSPSLRRKTPQPLRRVLLSFPVGRRESSSVSSTSPACEAGKAFSSSLPVDFPPKDGVTEPVASVDGGTGSRGRLKLEELSWDHSFVRELPGDPRTDAIPRQDTLCYTEQEQTSLTDELFLVSCILLQSAAEWSLVLHACYTKVLPSVEVENPQLVVWSESLAELLELDPKEFERPDFPLMFSGASTLPGALPYAQCYGGHQFGMWAGQLGDGRAITLGEILNSRGERWELQLKGAGRTPYSRFADGLAVLRSSIREFLCSEVMHCLGIPTTRALCLVTTGKGVIRDMFYDGNAKEEPGAIVCRVAQSFIRFGSFQIHASRGKEDFQIVRALADYTIRHHFPHLETIHKDQSSFFKPEAQEGSSVVDLSSNKYAAWSVEVAEQTASLIAKWQGVGFTHGVMNTDNMSVLGLTIDYGPFGFLDAFDPTYTPNTTDLPGRRYCFANQPDIGLWNVAQFTSTLAAAELITDDESNFAMERYGIKFMDEYQSIMTRKLGIGTYNKQLISRLLSNMAIDKVDYINFFRLLSNVKADTSISGDELLIPLTVVLPDISEERKEAWASWVQAYVQELASCGVSDRQRKVAMDSINPKYVLRNYLCQSAIEAAEQGDYQEVRRLLKVMERPYDEQLGMEKYASLPPPSCDGIVHVGDSEIPDVIWESKIVHARNFAVRTTDEIYNISQNSSFFIALLQTLIKVGWTYYSPSLLQMVGHAVHCILHSLRYAALLTFGTYPSLQFLVDKKLELSLQALRCCKKLELIDAMRRNLLTSPGNQLHVSSWEGVKEQLGRGSFGAVYKGSLALAGSATYIAVKKLEQVFAESEQEFIAEVVAIGQTRHKNLTKLIEFCNERQNRLLVYEYMSNGSRGLAYLHEE